MIQKVELDSLQRRGVKDMFLLWIYGCWLRILGCVLSIHTSVKKPSSGLQRNATWGCTFILSCMLTAKRGLFLSSGSFRLLPWLVPQPMWESINFPKGLLLVLSAVDLSLILWSSKEHTSHITLHEFILEQILWIQLFTTESKLKAN